MCAVHIQVAGLPIRLRCTGAKSIGGPHVGHTRVRSHVWRSEQANQSAQERQGPGRLALYNPGRREIFSLIPNNRTINRNILGFPHGRMPKQQPLRIAELRIRNPPAYSTGGTPIHPG